MALATVLFLSSCGFVPSSGADESTEPPQGRVVITGVSGLEQPAIPVPATYRPDSFFAIGDAPDEEALAVDFVLTIAMDMPEELRIRVIDAQNGNARELLDVTGDFQCSDRWDGKEVVENSEAARLALLGGLGVYSRSTTCGDSLRQQIGVILPEQLLAPVIRLVAFSSSVNGVPVRGAEIELARDFFYMAVIGDSIAWGNGLRRLDTIPALVLDAIEHEMDVHVILQNQAQFGATILPGPLDEPCTDGCWGEVPRTPMSVNTQLSILDRPDLLDLVLLNGCINDVGLEMILDPFVDRDRLVERTERFCGGEMSDLLRRVYALAPRARIVALGLYPIISEQSDLFGVQQFRRIVTGEPIPFVSGLTATLSENSRIFAETANSAIRQSVAEFNALNDDQPCAAALAVPSAGPQNAMFAPQSWLWNLTPQNQTLTVVNLDVDVLPEDPIAELRWQACFDHGGSSGWVTCLYASAGHPRPSGARAYAESVIHELRHLGVLPARPE
jgi:lysophospholipase L1-like esterase